MMSLLTELDKLKAEKAALIDQFISLKEKYQVLFYEHEESKSANENLKRQIEVLQNENTELKSSSDSNIHRENKQLLAKVKQLRRSSFIPQKSTPVKREKESDYEVEKIVKHRGKKGKREFLVRWKNFGKADDTWVKETDLSCPAILNEYKVKHRIA